MSRYRRAGPLLERDAEQQALADGVRRAGEGDGGLVLVEGPAGIGKSSLLDACVVEAERAGLGVLRVRGDELVMESSFAAVRELFWAEVRAIGVGQLEGASALASPVFAAEPWDGSDRDRVSSVLYGLYWLTADLTARRPLAIVVDDAQWLDAASARFLEYLARRIDELPVTLMVALRAGEPSGRAELGVALAQYAARRLRPSPLSEEASGQVVRGVLGARADDALLSGRARRSAGGRGRSTNRRACRARRESRAGGDRGQRAGAPRASGR
jgi:hypothetical protein